MSCQKFDPAAQHMNINQYLCHSSTLTSLHSKGHLKPMVVKLRQVTSPREGNIANPSCALAPSTSLPQPHSCLFLSNLPILIIKRKKKTERKKIQAQPPLSLAPPPKPSYFIYTFPTTFSEILSKKGFPKDKHIPLHLSDFG